MIIVNLIQHNLLDNILKEWARFFHEFSIAFVHHISVYNHLFSTYRQCGALVKEKNYKLPISLIVLSAIFYSQLIRLTGEHNAWKISQIFIQWNT